MPAPGSIRAGRAYVELYAENSKFLRGLRLAEKRLVAFGGAVKRIGLRLAALTSAIAAPLGGISIKAASDAQETLSRFEQVFGEQADAAREFATALAREVGRSKYAIIDALSTFQSFFVGLGFDPQEARGLSQTLQKLAIDFASFNNLSDEEAMQRFIAALSGSGEVLDRFGVNIKQAALQQELLAMGIDKSWQQVTEQEKALARLSVIMRAMGDQGAVGDAVRTAGSFANRMKALRGELRDAAVAIGQALLPVVTPLVDKTAAAARLVAAWAAENQQLVATAFKVAAVVMGVSVALIAFGAILTGLGSTFGVVAAVIKGAGAALGVLGTVLGALVSPIGLIVAAVTALGAIILRTTDLGAKALGWLAERFQSLRDDAVKSIGGIRDALASGDIRLAAEILWLQLKVVFEKGKASVTGVFQKLWYGALALAEEAFHGIEVAWIRVVAALKTTWHGFVAVFRSTWERITSWFAKRMLEVQGVFDAELDVEAAKQLVDEELSAKLGDISENASVGIDDVELKKERRLQRARELHEATMAEIGQDYEDAAGEAEKRLEQARRELEEAIAAAKAQREAREAGEPLPEGESPQDVIGRVRSILADLDTTLRKTASATINVKGAFNAAALRGLAVGGDSAERTARATEETARHTKHLARRADDGGLTFA